MSALSDDLLHHTDIVTLVGRYVQLRKVGKNRSGLCPFHKEKTPSFTVAEDKQIYKCFGCGKGGNAINFLMEIERIDYRDAAKILAKDAHLDLSKYERKKGEQGVSEVEEKREDLKSLNKTVEARFSSALVGSIGEEYLTGQRKLSHKTIQTFGLGYAPESYYQIIEVMQTKGFSGSQLVQASLARQGQNGEYTSFFRKRIMFPIWDHIGNVVGFAGRALTSDDMPKYLNISETPLYDKSKLLYGMHIAKSHLKEFGALIIVEGYMDVIALFDAGLPIGVASCGTALTNHHAKLLKRHTDQVIFSFDTDNAGFEATIRGLKVAYEVELYPSVLTLPVGFKDIDEFVHSDEDYKNYLLDPKHRQDGFLFLVTKLLGKYDSKNPVERKKIQNICFDVLMALQDYSIMMMYIEQLAFKLGTNQDSLFQQFKVYLKQKPKFANSQQPIANSQIGNNGQSTIDQKNPFSLFSAFSDPIFFDDFLGTGGKTKEMIRQLQQVIANSQQPIANSQQPDAILRRQHHYGLLLESKRAAEVAARIQKKLLPELEKFVIKSEIENKSEILQMIRMVKRG